CSSPPVTGRWPSREKATRLVNPLTRTGRRMDFGSCTFPSRVGSHSQTFTSQSSPATARRWPLGLNARHQVVRTSRARTPFSLPVWKSQTLISLLAARARRYRLSVLKVIQGGNEPGIGLPSRKVVRSQTLTVPSALPTFTVPPALAEARNLPLGLNA